MISIENLTTGYGKPNAETAVLKSLSCIIPTAAITVLVGPNGSGKSTLLKAACGLLPAWSGSVKLDGKPLSSYSLQMRAQKIAYLAQSRRTPDISVEQLVLYGRFPHRRFLQHYSETDRRIARAALEQLGLLPLKDTLLSALSGGQRQKAYLAMALSQQAALLVLDEPLTFLDIRQQLDLLQLLRALCAQGKSICLVVHDLNTALTFADTLIVMKEGTVAAQGKGAEIASSGIIDRVFAVKTKCITAADGKTLYTFSAED